MAIIAIHGHMGAGKDMVGKVIQYLMFSKGSWNSQSFFRYSNHLGVSKRDSLRDFWEIKKFAGPLRKIGAILLNMEEEYLYTDEFKQLVLPECWNVLRPTAGIAANIEVGMTGREFLQELGTKAIRNGLHKDAWVNALMGQYELTHKPSNYLTPFPKIEYPNWIITDLRFFNEYQAVKREKAITIKIHRHAQNTIDHESEVPLDDYLFDIIIDNTGTLNQLIEQVVNIHYPKIMAYLEERCIS